jgi:hypothetical protein
VSITLKPSEVSRMFSCLVHRGGSCGHNIPGLGRCPLNQKLCSQLVAVKALRSIACHTINVLGGVLTRFIGT